MNKEVCFICGQRAIAGLGDPPVWYCLDHFEEALADQMAPARQLLAGLRAMDGKRREEREEEEST